MPPGEFSESPSKVVSLKQSLMSILNKRQSHKYGNSIQTDMDDTFSPGQNNTSRSVFQNCTHNKDNIKLTTQNIHKIQIKMKKNLQQNVYNPDILHSQILSSKHSDQSKKRDQFGFKCQKASLQRRPNKDKEVSNQREKSFHDFNNTLYNFKNKFDNMEKKLC